MGKSRLRPEVRDHGTRSPFMGASIGSRAERTSDGYGNVRKHTQYVRDFGMGKTIGDTKSGIGPPARAAHVIEISNSIPAKRFDDLWDADSDAPGSGCRFRRAQISISAPQ